MKIQFHSHALERMCERGAEVEEVIETIETGEYFPAKYGRHGFRKTFPFSGLWKGRQYSTKEIEAYAVLENGWIVITVLVKYF